MIRHESSREHTPSTATEKGPSDEPQEAADRRPAKPMTSEDALRLSIKLAVDAGNYERAIALLEVAKRTETKLNPVTRLTMTHDRKDR